MRTEELRSVGLSNLRDGRIHSWGCTCSVITMNYMTIQNAPEGDFTIEGIVAEQYQALWRNMIFEA